MNEMGYAYVIKQVQCVSFQLTNAISIQAGLNMTKNLKPQNFDTHKHAWTCLFAFSIKREAVSFIYHIH